MKTKKTLMTTAICGALIFGLAACGSAETATVAEPVAPPAAPSSAAPSEPVAPPETPTATETPDTGTSSVETIAVTPGGFFYLPTPEGFNDVYKGGEAKELNITQDYDPALVMPAPFNVTEVPADTVKPESIDGVGDSLLWKVVDGASGTATIEMSYTDPKSGETKMSALVVNIG